ncbi:MAG: hypothetical protein WDA41_10255 [Candidatus Neomarinimicrobiota bacterium]
MVQDNFIDKVEVKKVYYKSGALWWETPYVNGKIHGIAKEYYSTGVLRREIPYVNGKRYGIERGYYESGSLWYETPYKDGIRHGISKNYDKDTLNINCLILCKRSYEVLTICLESYKRLYI